MGAPKPLPRGWFAGEFTGTFLLVFFGCGSVAAAVLTGAQVGIFQVAIIWGLGIATAIYLTASLSGAHLNPAVTCSLASTGRFPWAGVPGYVAAQFLGAFAASAVLFGVFGGALRLFEATHHIVRGAPGSEASAMIFGEFYPNPAWQAAAASAVPVVSAAVAFLAEAAGTAVLVLVILCSTDPRNASKPGILTAATIGLTVTILISIFGPITMAGFNPARDLAPRLFSSLAGWGSLPFSSNGAGWVLVYVLAPLVGGQAAALAYRRVFRPLYEANPSIG
jgi:glycerol uptake facilitator protein